MAIIGTGATAIQCVPHLGRRGQAALRLPAHALLGRPARQQADRSGLGRLAEPGWQKRRMENFNILVSGGLQDEDLVSDGWTDIIRNLTSIAAVRGESRWRPRRLGRAMELADFRKMNQVRAPG